MANIDPRRLETLRLVAEAGKISTAARLLHLSQPAVTAQVRALEESCGRALLVRTNRGVTPTPWGRRLLEAATRVHDVLVEAAAALAEEEQPVGELLLAASMTTAAYVVPQLLAAFRSVHGPVPFRLEVGNTAQVVEWIAAGRVRLGMVEGASRSARLHLERYLTDELVPVASPSVPAFRELACAAHLARVPLLLREPGSGSRQIVERALGRALGPRRVLRGHLQLGSNQSVKMAAVAGLGVAFLSRWSVALELSAGKLRVLPLRDLRIERAFSWAAAGPAPGGGEGRFLAWARRNPPSAP
jgi:DNA-binding transcriptional LysR family regulator